MALKIVVILALPGVQLLDVSGPLDVFAEANIQAGHVVYDLRIASSSSEIVTCSSGARLMADFIVGLDVQVAIDTLLVAGCRDQTDGQADPTVTQWLVRVAPKTRRFGSVCAGAFALAATGLLDRRRITTHWAVAQSLAEKYPAVVIDEDAIHVKDGPVRTAAGVTAGLDLALALVEEDLGRDIAMKVAAQLVMFFKRPGGQMQFSRKQETVPAGRAALQELQRWVMTNPAIDHNVSSLADRMSLSPRHFSRLFRHEVGITPAAWVEATRVSAARQLLETGPNSPKQVAVECGFADVDVLRRSFKRHVGITPAEYRKRFATAA